MIERVPLAELRRRYQAHALAAPVADANLALARAALGAGRRVAGARLVLHGDPGIGLPALLLELEGPAGHEALAVAPGPAAFDLLAETLGEKGEVATELLALPDDPALARLAPSPGARAAAAASAPAAADLAQEEERVFARIVAASNPWAASDLLRAVVDVLLEEVDGERGLVAVAREGRLRPEVARLRGGKDLPDPEGEVPRRVFEKVAATRRPAFVEDLLDPTLSLVPSQSILAKQVRSFLAAPLLHQGEVSGILYVDRRDRPARFDGRARRLFERLAERVAGLLAHALEREGAVAALAGEEGAQGLLDLVGGSKPMRALYREVERLARQDVDVLLLGESGTGKELVARALHRLGRRQGRRFEALNCAALPETLLDSALFGHVRGAFTGADRDRPGLLAETDGGTLFLDEVGDMPAALQVKLLRTLDEGEVRPVGSTRAQQVDVRFLAATHRDLGAMVANGSFRQDLYYRLTAAETLHLPPLRERREDVPPLARHFLARFASKHGSPARRFTGAALERLAAHDWPGNVRELRNVVLHTCLRAHGESLGPEALVFAGTRPVPARLEAALPTSAADVVPFKDHVRDYLARVHEIAQGNVSRMSELLGEPRSTVRDWLTKCGIVKPRRKKA